MVPRHFSPDYIILWRQCCGNLIAFDWLHSNLCCSSVWVDFVAFQINGKNNVELQWEQIKLNFFTMWNGVWTISSWDSMAWVSFGVLFFHLRDTRVQSLLTSLQITFCTQPLLSYEIKVYVSAQRPGLPRLALDLYSYCYQTIPLGEPVDQSSVERSCGLIPTRTVRSEGKTGNFCGWTVYLAGSKLLPDTDVSPRTHF